MIRKRELREAKECAEEYKRLWHEEMGRSDGVRRQTRALAGELAEVPVLYALRLPRLV